MSDPKNISELVLEAIEAARARRRPGEAVIEALERLILAALLERLGDGKRAGVYLYFRKGEPLNTANLNRCCTKSGRRRKRYHLRTPHRKFLADYDNLV